MLGIPAEYFHRGDDAFWRQQWDVADEHAFLEAMQPATRTPNGVWGSKMMWNYFADALARLREWSAWGSGQKPATQKFSPLPFPDCDTCGSAARTSSDGRSRGGAPT